MFDEFLDEHPKESWDCSTCHTHFSGHWEGDATIFLGQPPGAEALRVCKWCLKLIKEKKFPLDELPTTQRSSHAAWRPGVLVPLEIPKNEQKNIKVELVKVLDNLSEKGIMSKNHKGLVDVMVRSIWPFVPFEGKEFMFKFSHRDE